MRTIVLKGEETLMDYELEKDLTEDKIEKVQNNFEEILSNKTVQSITFEFIDNISMIDVNSFMSDPTPNVVVTQTIRIKE